MNKEQPIKTNYQPADKKNWQGRSSVSDKENEYWHQEIQLLDINELKALKSSEKIKFGLLGYKCDEGVRRNQGRPGAKAGPEAIRHRVAKIPIHFSDKAIYDLGDVVCIEQNMEACQEALAQSVKKMLENQITPIVIGGSHDVAYGHFKGLERTLAKGKRIGIINFDAHFDLRRVVEKPNSGTPFNQILTEFDPDRRDYFVIGIQQQGNTKELFEIAISHDVKFVTHNKSNTSNDDLENLKNQLEPFISNCDALYITIDLDGFSSAYASGVSAPSPLGFSPDFFFKAMTYIMASQKVISYDIAELNPKFDIDNHTATLAARIVDYIVASP